MPTPRPKHFAALSGLRFLAAAGIVVEHWQGFAAQDYLSFLHVGGFHVVSFFFLLSGFVLSHAYARMETEPQAGRFLFARIQRVFPVHLVCLALVIALVPRCRHLALTLPGVLLVNLFLLQSWMPDCAFISAFNPPSWSISADLFCYLCFPLLIRNWTATWLPKLACAFASLGARRVAGRLPQSPEGPFHASCLGRDSVQKSFRPTVRVRHGHDALFGLDQALRKMATRVRGGDLHLGTAGRRGWCSLTMCCCRCSGCIWSRNGTCPTLRRPGSGKAGISSADQRPPDRRDGLSGRPPRASFSARVPVFLGEMSYSTYMVHYSASALVGVRFRSKRRFRGPVLPRDPGTASYLDLGLRRKPVAHSCGREALSAALVARPVAQAQG